MSAGLTRPSAGTRKHYCRPFHHARSHMDDEQQREGSRRVHSRDCPLLKPPPLTRDKEQVMLPALDPQQDLAHDGQSMGLFHVDGCRGLRPHWQVQRR